ncbi:ubiquinone biosynthesis monooxygenase Coq6 [Mariprofundus micogutta]|uniref:Ubiquinone biosynthesis monooxygenase Coq6 n=1 Tax=Mariprofundus micogutta TaxID=1921010 RepID=A0A1L8CP56_9PROT|nr:FAD-dependent oxidoreductase [Mariprofundus micogutta]GAV20688.1 ubiquinone biosynthesis monooxygenase Coq6 [Mariprofundus micogutta]
MKDNDFDIVIVGGGAVGITLALELDRLDYRVAVIERFQPTFSSSSPERVIALNYGSRCHLERLGVWDAVASQGVGDIRHIVVGESGNVGRVDLDAADGLGFAPNMQELGYVVEMGLLLQPMYELIASSSVELFSGATVQQFVVTDNGVELELQSAGQSTHLKAALLVGADGTHSQIRQMAGIGLFGWDYNRFGLVASVSCEKGHNDTAHECFRRSGPLAFLPLADDRFSIVWAAAPAEASQLLSMSDETFISALQRAAGDTTIDQIGNILSTSPRASYPLELSIAKQYAKPRIALVGNAAHTIHPVAGQGMNLGFRDVVSLVEMLDGELAHSDPGQPIIMQGYAEKRRADVMAVAGFTESMSHLFGSEVPGVKWLRGMGLEKLPLAPTLSGLLLKQASGVGQITPQRLEV